MPIPFMNGNTSDPQSDRSRGQPTESWDRNVSDNRSDVSESDNILNRAFIAEDSLHFQTDSHHTDQQSQSQDHSLSIVSHIASPNIRSPILNFGAQLRLEEWPKEQIDFKFPKRGPPIIAEDDIEDMGDISNCTKKKMGEKMTLITVQPISQQKKECQITNNKLSKFPTKAESQQSSTQELQNIIQELQPKSDKQYLLSNRLSEKARQLKRIKHIK